MSPRRSRQHTYTDPDYYVVSVKGTVPSLNSTNLNLGYNYAQTNQITEIFNWGRTGSRRWQGP